MGWHPQDEDFTTPKRREKRGAGTRNTDGMGRSKLPANWYGFITKPFRITPGVPNRAMR